MEIHLNIIGVVLIVLGLVHVIFPKYFRWKEELQQLSLINKQMMEVHTFFIALVVVLMGILCLTSANELIESSLGKNIALGLGIFWGFRLFVQLFIYSSKLWKGKVFETIVHIVFTCLWLYLTIVFVGVYLG